MPVLLSLVCVLTLLPCGLDGPELDISPLSLWLQLDSGILFIPTISQNRRIVSVHGLFDGLNFLALDIFLKGFALKHQVLCFGKRQNPKTVRHPSAVIQGGFHALHIG